MVNETKEMFTVVLVKDIRPAYYFNCPLADILGLNNKLQEKNIPKILEIDATPNNIIFFDVNQVQDADLKTILLNYELISNLRIVFQIGQLWQ